MDAICAFIQDLENSKIFVTKQSYFDDFSLRQIISNNMYDTCYTIYLSRYANVRYPELKFDFKD